MTTALAVQLVVTLREMPSEEVQAKIEAALARLDGLENLDDPYAQVKAVEKEILTLLIQSGLVEEQDTTASSATGAPAPAPTVTSPSPTTGSTATTEAPATTAP